MLACNRVTALLQKGAESGGSGAHANVSTCPVLIGIKAKILHIATRTLHAGGALRRLARRSRPTTPHASRAPSTRSPCGHSVLPAMLRSSRCDCQHTAKARQPSCGPACLSYWAHSSFSRFAAGGAVPLLFLGPKSLSASACGTLQASAKSLARQVSSNCSAKESGLLLQPLLRKALFFFVAGLSTRAHRSRVSSSCACNKFILASALSLLTALVSSSSSGLLLASFLNISSAGRKTTSRTQPCSLPRKGCMCQLLKVMPLQPLVDRSSMNVCRTSPWTKPLAMQACSQRVSAPGYRP